MTDRNNCFDQDSKSIKNSCFIPEPEPEYER